MTVKMIKEVDVAIIGAGMAGLCAAMKLRKMGINNFVILEKSNNVGGTWRDNVYPGCACDSPALCYSFSFELKSDWSNIYPHQPEMLAYLEQCTNKYELEPFILFDAELESARFEEDKWLLQTTKGDVLHARILISAVGQLNRPVIPNFVDQNKFKGISFHSARWDKQADLRGKRVAIIGNGSSGAQIISSISTYVDQLFIFQRSPSWVLPRIVKERRVSRAWKRVLQHVPFVARLNRIIWWSLPEAFFFPIFTEKHSWLGNILRPILRKNMLKPLYDNIHNPALQEKLIPDYEIGCKRVVFSDEYYQAFARQNVSLVTDPILRFTDDGIITEKHTEYKVDAIIYATGFESTKFLSPIKIEGLGHVSLQEVWAKGPDAYLGIGVPGFPNFFILYGPNTNLGHASVIFMIECQVNYIMQCIHIILEGNLKYLDVKEEVFRQWQHEMQSVLKQSVWAKACHSWYKTADGKITNNWPYSQTSYWLRLRSPHLSDYLQIK